MNEDIALPFDLPSVCRKKLSVGFEGGRLSSDAGLLLLRGIERQLGLAARLAGCIREWRDPERIEHSLVEMLKLRMFAIAAGYEDANDCGSLRHDPVFKMAVGRLPESGDALCSQPTMSRPPTIDTFVDFRAEWSGTGVRFVGVVRGDDFPNAEVFVLDSRGTGCLLFDGRTTG